MAIRKILQTMKRQRYRWLSDSVAFKNPIPFSSTAAATKPESQADIR